MKAGLWMAVSATLLAAAACSGGQDKDGNAGASNGQSAGSGRDTSQRGPATRMQLTRIIDCSEAFRSVATLYRVMGGTRTGADADRLRQSSEQRDAAARQLAIRAAAVGAELGIPEIEVRSQIREARERSQREARVGDFADFAVRQGREADRCVAELPGLL
ncbi:MAG TPA: hypothetical protein VEX35_13070 [Allosphingosinicella sp.]|nr:hypothetical protein [Allosphingosinicella sp.]